MTKIAYIAKKPLYPKLDINISDKVCLYSVLFCIFQFIFSCICLIILKNTILYQQYSYGEISAQGQLIIGLSIALPTFLALLIFMKATKQPLSTLGLKRDGLKSSLIIGMVLLIAYLLAYFKTNKLNIDLVYYIIFFCLAIGLYEEVMFRGFLWPRIQKLVGKRYGFFISGLFFGLIHIPFQVIWNNISLYDAIIGGSSSNINILGGLVAHLFFGYIYTRNDNIVLPSFVHGILDLTQII